MEKVAVGLIQLWSIFFSKIVAGAKPKRRKVETNQRRPKQQMINEASSFSFRLPRNHQAFLQIIYLLQCQS